jgi:hypothetical protein
MADGIGDRTFTVNSALNQMVSALLEPWAKKLCCP